MFSPALWLGPSERELEISKNLYTDVSVLPALDGTNSTSKDFLSPCWEWGPHHIAALRVIDLGAELFPIDSWVAAAVDEYEERGKILLDMLRRTHFAEGTFLSSLWDQDENVAPGPQNLHDEDNHGDPVNLGRGVYRHILPAILASTPTQVSRGDYHLRYHEDAMLLPFPMANVPYRWKARMSCGVVVERGHHHSRVPVLGCLVDATLAEVVGTMIAMVAVNLSQLKDGYTDQECYCINLSHNSTHMVFYAALFTSAYIAAVRCHPVLPQSARLFVRRTREFDLHVPEDRVEMAEHLRGLAFYMTSGDARIGRIQLVFRDQDACASGTGGSPL